MSPALWELLVTVSECERRARLFDVLEGHQLTAAHKCSLPGSGARHKCPECGQEWVRELGGGWLTA